MTNGDRMLTREESAKKTLEREVSRNVAGANFAHSRFGDQGKLAYERYMEGEEIRRLQEQEYQELKQDYKNLEVVGEPTYPVKQDTSYKIMAQIREDKPFVLLGDLEQIIKSITPDFEFKLPENLKKSNYMSLMKKAMTKGALDKEKGTINHGKLSKQENEAFEIYGFLNEAYDGACSLNVLNSDYISRLNAQAKQINEKYHPSETPTEQ